MVKTDIAVFQCPVCEYQCKLIDYELNDIFDLHFYSDSWVANPELPDQHEFARCGKCGGFIWLNSQNEIPVSESEMDKIDYCKFPDIEGYKEALINSWHQTTEEEHYMRRRLWWLYNHRVRLLGKLSDSPKDMDDYEGNLHRYATLLDSRNHNHRKVLAEVYRNLGKFTESIEVSYSVLSTTYRKPRMILERECLLGNRFVKYLGRGYDMFY